MKKILTIILFLLAISVFFFAAENTNAGTGASGTWGSPGASGTWEPTGYVPLENVPGLTSGQPVSFSSYLAAIYKVGIILAAVLAVLMIVIGGIQYMLAGGNPGKLGDAKDRIWQAILGLLLVLGSWLILSTVNPKLVTMEFSMETITTTAATPPTPPLTPEQQCAASGRTWVFVPPPGRCSTI